MGATPSQCCRSERAIKSKDDQEANGEEVVWPDNTSQVGDNRCKKPSPYPRLPQAPGNPGLNELADEQTPIELDCPEVRSSLRSPMKDHDLQLSPALPKQVSFIKDSTEEEEEERALARRNKKADTKLQLRQMKSFDSTSSRHSKGSNGHEDGDNINALINNIISKTIARPEFDSPEIAREAEFAKELLRSDSAILAFKNKQSSIHRIVEHLFVQDDLAQITAAPSNYSSSSFVASISVSGMKFRKNSRRIINNTCFTIFFMVLTFYAIFGPDLVILLLSKKHDKPFFIANTVVFFLFIFELVLLMLGKSNYICTVTCLLDVVSVASLLSDTIFLQGELMSEDNARVGRMARSSRMTRLARLVRVARVTRLLPRLMRLCGTQRNELATKLLMRRLWRSFLYLDRNNENIITYRDLKCFYLGVLCNASHMLTQGPEELLKADMPLLSKGDHPKDTLNYLEFDDYKRIMLSTALGKNLVQYHVQDVDRDEGVWIMTQKLSDNIALKVCVGLLILIGVMDLLDVEAHDGGTLQGLEQLIQVARSEPSVNGIIMDTTYLCEQISIYVKRYAVLYLYLEGATYYKDKHCLQQGINRTMLNPFEHIKEVINQYDLRDREYLQNCQPDDENCDPAVVTSMSLIDNRDQVKVQMTGDVLTTVIVIVLLLVFVYVLNLGITSFSKTLLQPLRALVDDMTAMSALELVSLDRDMPGADKGMKKAKVVEELVHLQLACKSMRGAVKSWAKYVPPAVVERLYSSGVEAQIGVARVQATIMFCDIQEFEAVCRGFHPNEVLNLLSQVLSKIADVIEDHNGTLLEFIGDEVLACFNTPSPQKEHKFAGASTAVQIHRVIRDLHIKMADGSETQIRCRCGVHSGSILAGNLGSHLRMKYGLLGDGINLTARLKGINTRYHTRTLATDAISADPSVATSFISRPVDLVAVKGKSEPTPVYELLCLRHLKEHDDEYMLELGASCETHRKAFDLYRERHFAEAKALLQEVQHVFDEADSPFPSEMLVERCQRYIEEPPPADWDGVERLTKK